MASVPIPNRRILKRVSFLVLFLIVLASFLHPKSSSLHTSIASSFQLPRFPEKQITPKVSINSGESDSKNNTSFSIPDTDEYFSKDETTKEKPHPYTTGETLRDQVGKENAAIIMLVRNSELYGAIGSIETLEKKFNQAYKYPYVFLNDEPFTEDFKTKIIEKVSSHAYFGLIPEEQWSFPSEKLDANKALSSIERMGKSNIIYGYSVSYRHMCRYNSGFFYRHPLVQQFKYYWRVEPDVKFYCTIDYDVFELMRTKDYKYGFTISMYEFESTIPTLWSETVDFLADHPSYLAENNSVGFIVDSYQSNGFPPVDQTSQQVPTFPLTKDEILALKASEYNRCHFWSNFEIADLDFWRSKEYSDYFNYLDSRGGFFYERWGDAPVHSLAVQLFLPKEKVHHFADIGYYHAPYGRCPKGDEFRSKCDCDPEKDADFDEDGYSCLTKWWNVAGKNVGA